MQAADLSIRFKDTGRKLADEYEREGEVQVLRAEIS